MSRFRHLLLATALVPLAIGPASAGPDGANVVGGAATIQGQGTANVVINQSTDRAIINWTHFNIGAGETTQFIQPGSSSIALNRVTGGLGPTEILGTLSANGRVFVINRDGILFGPNAVVDTAGFLATTHDIKNDDFMAGRYNFTIPGRPDASIINQGTITAHSAGFAALVAPGVRNSGTITATLGTVGLAAGNGFTLDFYGDRLISLAVGDSIGAQVRDVQTGQPLTSLVENTGRLRANGGRVELTAAAARQVVDSVINNRGVIEANTIGRRNGMIVLGAATAATRPAGAPTQTVRLSGTLSAAGRKSGRKGGRIVVTGENIEVAGARIDVSGPAGGGTVLIGGDWSGGNPIMGLVNNPSAQLENGAIPTASTVTIDSATTINASATENGIGGKVIVWADGATTFAGSILATGGPAGGDGGFVEVSGRQQLQYTGLVDLRAPSGTTGTLLLDPTNMYVNADGIAPASDPGSSAIAASTVQSQVAMAHVLIATGAPGSQAGDIRVDADVSWSGSNNLTFSAFRNIDVAPGVTIANIGAGHLVMRADNTGTGTGTVRFLEDDSQRQPIVTPFDGPLTHGPLPFGPNASTGPLPRGMVDFSQSTGTVAIFYNPGSYADPTPYGANVKTTTPNQLTAFMLVNNTADLEAIASNPNGTYAMGRNIDTGGYLGMPAGTIFNGVFDANGGLGVNHTISNLPLTLFPAIGPDAFVRNVTLANVSITANADNQFIGALAHDNLGHLFNINVNGAIHGGGFSGLIAGGLVAQNGGTILQSVSSVNLDAGTAASLANRSARATSASDFNIFGGLTAINFGTIEQSESRGSVSTGGFGIAAGFVALNAGTITRSTASGAVNAGDGSFAGGFFGFNVFGGIDLSSSSGPVTAGNDSFVGGFGAANLGQIATSSSTGAATGGDNSQVAGFVAINLGLPTIPVPSLTAATAALAPPFGIGAISQSFATGAATGGANSNVAGLVAINGGPIDQTYATGPVAGGPGSTLGGLIALSTASFTLPDDLPVTVPPVVLQPGTVTNSYWDQQTTGQTTSAGGTGMTTAQLRAALPAGFDSAVWAINAGQSYPFLPTLATVPPGPTTPPGPTLPPDPPVVDPLPPDPPVVTPNPPVVTPDPPVILPIIVASLIDQATAAANASLQVNDILRLADPNLVLQAPLVTPPTQTTRTTQSRPTNPPTGNDGLRPDGRPSNVPPPGETRFINDQVVVHIDLNVSPQVLDRVARRLGLTVISSQTLGLLGRRVIQFRIGSGRSVANVIVELEKQRIVDDAVPNYEFVLAQDATAPAAGDAAQYVIAKLRLAEAHRLARGDNVLIAVIDSEIDAKHPDIEGAIHARYDGAGPAEKAHPHGTGMAGAIASHRKLMGTAPGARILAIRAFGAGAKGTSVDIAQGRDWAASQGARIVNMSFAGPKDPTLQKAFKAASDKGMVLIAAAGNAGPKSPPLYPGADPNVIAVSATDADDKVYDNANRGKYIAVAAPGVDILVPAPDGNYEFTTGTSVAAAHVSGVAALLLQRDPKLDPAGIREILTSTANSFGARGGRSDELGYGLVDPVRALQAVGAKSAGAPASGAVAARRN